MMYKKDSKKTAWSGDVGKWYKTLVGKEGSFYHQKIVIPGALRLLNLKKEESKSLLPLCSTCELSN